MVLRVKLLGKPSKYNTLGDLKVVFIKDIYKSKILPCQVLYPVSEGWWQDWRSSSAVQRAVVNLLFVGCCHPEDAQVGELLRQVLLHQARSSWLVFISKTQVVELQCQVLYQGCVNPDVVRELFSRRRCASLCQVVVQ